MQTLADHEIASLKLVRISGESAWFEGGRDGCMISLLTVLGRQSELEKLALYDNDLTEEQKG